MSLNTLEWSLIQNALKDRTRSPLGLTQAQNHLPFDSKQEALSLLEKTKEATEILVKTPLIASYLSGTQDPTDLFERCLRNGTLEPENIFVCGHFFETVGILSEELPRLNNIAPSWARAFLNAPKTPSVCEQIRKSVNSDGSILDSASPFLAELRAKRIQKKSELESVLDTKIKDWHSKGWLQDDFYDVREGRYVVPVKTESQSKLQGILFGKSNTGQSLFIEPLELATPNNAIKELEFSIRAEELKILRNLSSEIGMLANQYFPWISVLAKLDLSFAAAILAQNWELNPPTLSNTELKLENLFHPALKLQAIDPIKNDFILERSGEAFLITGPNTGGKTVFIKSVGLACMMAKAGLYVPAKPGAKIPFYRQVKALIGDEQDLSKGLSSFSAQVLELKNLLENTQGSSLILIDEILSSTDPEEASALSLAVLEDLVSKENHILVTTHFGNLARSAKLKENFSVAAMEFKQGSPTYRLCKNEFGSSHALEIARKLGFSENILAKAKSFISQAKLEYEKAVNALKQKQSELEIEHQKKIKDLEYTQETLRKEKDSIIAKHNDEIESLKKSYQEFVEQTKRELATTQTKGKQALTVIRKKAQQKLPELAVQPALPEFEVGQKVRIPRLREYGTVLELNKDAPDPFAIVQVKHFKNKFLLTELELFKEQRTSKTTFYEENNISPSIPNKLDLRGKRLEEALRQAEAYLDQALRSNQEQVTLITGHGTGALKKGIRKLLDSLPYVKNYKPERINDDGALVVEFE